MRLSIFMVVPLLVAGVAASIVAGCGSTPEPTWFPLNKGASWQYDVLTEIDGNSKHDSQRITVVSNGQLNGKPVYTRRSEMSDNVGVEYLLQVSSTAITRVAQRTDLQDLPVAEEFPRTVMKLPLQVGATWSTPTVAYAVIRKTEYPREMKFGRGMPMIYSVEALDDKVEVPAGRFDHCARVVGRADLTVYADPVSGFRKTPITTTEWYCKDVGLVKLVRVENLDTSFFGGGKIEMTLTDYTTN